MKYFIGIIQLLLLSSGISSQVNQFPDLSEGLLWKIEHPESNQASYLFGTIHMIPSEHFFLPEGFSNAFSKSSKVFMEINMDDMSSLENLMGMMDKMMMRDDTTLSDLLHENDYETIKNYFNKSGLPLALFERFKPMFLSALVSVDGNPMDLQGGSIKSYELELSKMAKEENKELGGLETLDFQLSIFDSIPYSVQAKLLLESVQSSENKSEPLEEIYSHYIKEDLAKMVEQVETSDPTLAPYLEMLVYKRNENWIPSIIEAMKYGSCFFAVGAGHLGGEKGLLNLMIKNGFKINRV